MNTISTLLVLAAAALSNAQCVTVAAQIPSCGVSCLSSAASAVGCAQTDLACQCSSSQSSAIQSAALDCIVNGCGAITGRQVSSSVEAVCSCVVNAGSGTYQAFPLSIRNEPRQYGSILPVAQTKEYTATSTSTTSTAPPQQEPPIVWPPGIPAPIPIPTGDEPGDPEPTPSSTSPDTPTSSRTTTSTSTSTVSTILGTVYEAWFNSINVANILSVASQIYAVEVMEACITPTTSYSIIGSICSNSAVPTPAVSTPSTTFATTPTPPPPVTGTTSPTTVSPTQVSTQANPTTSSEPQSPATQSCHATEHPAPFIGFVSYSVLIGIPYGGANDCDATYHALNNGAGTLHNGGVNRGTLISNWQCVNSGGNIQLWFNAPIGDGDKINTSLESRYPSVAGGFNCPDN